MLELEDRFWVEQVRWSLAPPLVLAAHSETAVRVAHSSNWISAAVALLVLVGNDFETDPSEDRRGTREVLSDEVLTESDRLESLSTRVRGNGGNAHLAHDFENTLTKRLDHVVNRGVDINAGNHALIHQVLHAFHREIGVNGRSAKANHECNVVHLSNVASLHDDAHLHALFTANQVVMDRREHQQ